MISNVDPAAELFLADTNRIQQRIADANRQVSSGSRISVAADAPDQIGSLLQLRANQLHNQQIQSNLVLAKANTDAADTALSGAIKLLDSALTLANQGTSVDMTAASYGSLAQQVQSLQEQMVQYSLTTVQGRYIFSGDQSSSPGYVFDLTPPAPTDGTDPLPGNGVDSLIAAQTASRRVEDPAGGSFAAAKSGQEIFDHGRPTTSDGTFASDNVFAALNNLRVALLTNDQTKIANTIGSIRAASDHLNAVEAFYGDVQSRIQNASDFAGSYDVSLKTQISQIQDADVTSAALELTQDSNQLQAAFQMRAKMPHTSLFDYLG